ncbi:cyclase family protein [Anaerolinea thermophila]|uniref:Cyclase family protein n=1 Tax=Anaerolinea thermophila (strain DSM 14523 / JCM 11388 / NBRC 100420 / UNI-1) TaxID=926569 RepID=E8MZP0_ANATU|nr:cyclase family protein [Anaerolinea thermophila]BAJ64588.1 hypothetical protein ANT_25620 [Anaerolinea thermophila UNI-1]
MPVLKFSRVVELSHPIHPEIPQWQGDPPVIFTPHTDIPSSGYFLRAFSMGEHSGTHLNAPASFITGGRGVDEIPAGQLLLPAVVISITEKARANPDYALSLEDITRWEQHHGEIPAGALVLLHTGWSQFWNDPQRYYGLDEQHNTHFPGFDTQCARFLMTQRGAAGLGCDTPGVEPAWDIHFSVNRCIAEHDGLALENLTNLQELPPIGAWVFIGRLALKDGSGSPICVLGLTP